MEFSEENKEMDELSEETRILMKTPCEGYKNTYCGDPEKLRKKYLHSMILNFIELCDKSADTALFIDAFYGAEDRIINEFLDKWLLEKDE